MPGAHCKRLKAGEVNRATACKIGRQLDDYPYTTGAYMLLELYTGGVISSCPTFTTHLNLDLYIWKEDQSRGG